MYCLYKTHYGAQFKLTELLMKYAEIEVYVHVAMTNCLVIS